MATIRSREVKLKPVYDAVSITEALSEAATYLVAHGADEAYNFIHGFFRALMHLKVIDDFVIFRNGTADKPIFDLGFRLTSDPVSWYHTHVVAKIV